MPAFAAEVTVSSGTWSAAGVQPGDAVTITGSCENDISDIVLGSLTVTAAAETTVEISGQAFSFGAGGLTRTGAGTVKFLTDVHGTGAVSLSNGPTYLYGATCGLGDADSVITENDVGAQLYLGGTVLKNGKVIANYRAGQSVSSQNNLNYAYPIRAVGATDNVVWSKLALKASSCYHLCVGTDTDTAATLTLRGGAGEGVFRNYYFRRYGEGWSPSPRGTVTIADTPITCEKFGCDDGNQGLPPALIVSVAGMKAKTYIALTQADGTSTLETTVDWAFNAQDEATDCGEFWIRKNQKFGTVKLNGTKQRFGGFSFDTSSGNVTASGTITGTAGSVFYCRQWKTDRGTSARALGVNVKGAVTFVKEGTNSLFLAGTANDTTGALKVSEGRLVLGSAARFTALSSLVVGADAADTETVVSAAAVTPTLVLNHASNVKDETPLYVNGAGVVEAAVDVAVTNLTIDGVLMPAGMYSSALCPASVPAADRAAVMAHFAGEGTVQALDGAAVASKETAWTGAAGTLRFNDADNWSNGVPANNDDVSISVSAETTIANDIEGLVLKTLAFAGNGSVRLTGQALSVMSSIVAGTDRTDATAVTNVLDVSVSFADVMSVDALGSKRSLVFNRAVDNGGYAMTRGGNGIVWFMDNVTGDGDVTLAYDRTLAGYEAHTYVYGAVSALGGAGSRLVVVGKGDYNNKSALYGAFLHLCGATLENGTVYFDGYMMRPNSGVQYFYLVSEKADRANTVKGAVSLSDSGTTLFVATKAGAHTVLSGGGVTSSLRNVPYVGTNPWETNGAGLLEIAGKAWTISANFNSESDSAGFFDAKLGATITGLQGLCWYKAKLEFVTDWVFGGSDDLTAQVPVLKSRYSNYNRYYDGGTVNLNGTKQRIGGSDANINDYASFTGTAGSELHWKQTTGDITVQAAFKDGLCLVKEGANKVTLSGTKSTSTGALKVADGVLSLSSAAAWADKTPVEISGTGVLDLNFVGRKKVASLTINGVSVVGLCGAVGSGAPNEISSITGTGLLKAGKSGTVLILPLQGN